MTGASWYWPDRPLGFGSVVLRKFRDDDVHLAVELGADPYIPLIDSLPANPTAEQAMEWIQFQHRVLEIKAGLSFAIADAETGRAVGTIALWLHELLLGRATVGYAVSPEHRRRGVASSALRAVIAYAWTIPVLYRVELYVEPWNTASIRVAETAGFQRERLILNHQEIGGVPRDAFHYALRRP